jgi:transposase
MVYKFHYEASAYSWGAVMLNTENALALSDFDHQVFAAVVPADHYLRRVKTLVDFDRFRPRLNDLYSVTLGRPAIDPIRMLKILFLRFHYKLSDRQVMERTKTDMVFRWFLDLSLHEAVPHHTEGTYFRKRIGVERWQQVFQDLVGLAREHGLVSDRLRLKDATHLFADAAEVTPLALAAQVRERLLQAAEPLLPGWVAEQRLRVAALRDTTAELADAERLAARVEHLRELATQLRERVAALPPGAEGPRQRLDKALTLAAKLLADRDDPEAPDRLGNAVDPDARTGLHGRYFLGYLLDMAIDADSELITAVNVLPGNGPEAADTITLIQQEEAAQGNQVEGVSLDGAGYNGPVLRELTDPAGLNLEVTVPPPKASPRTTFGPERFTLKVLENGCGEVTCPAGQSTRQRERLKDKHGCRYTFKPKQCAGCSLREQCLQNPQSAKGRTVIKNDYEAEYRRVEAKAATAAYIETRRLHPKIERKLNDVVRHHGCRRACFRGRAKVLGQALLTAWVVNVKRLTKLIGDRLREATPTIAVRAALAET